MDTYSDRIHLGKVKVHGAPVVLQKRQRNRMICDFVLEGMTQVTAAKTFKISKGRVQEILRTHFPKEYKLIRRHPRVREHFEEKKDRNLMMVGWYKEGCSISEVAKYFNLSDGRTYQIIKREIARELKGGKNG